MKSTEPPLKVQMGMRSRYHIHDASGRLPTDIAIGLCRRSPSDTDTRDVSLPVAGSVLDIQHALANDILKLHERKAPDATTGSSRWNQLDLSHLKDTFTAAEPSQDWITLPHSSNTSAPSFEDRFTVYRYRIEPDGVLAPFLEPGKTYRITFTGKDLGVEHVVYSDHDQAVNPQDQSAVPRRVVHSKKFDIRAQFKVVESLVWPPKVETRMCLLEPTTADHGVRVARLQFTITNTGHETVSVQSRGQQSFLVPWGPFQPEDSDGLDAGDFVRIVNSSPSIVDLQVFRVGEETAVRDYRKRGPCGGLRPPSVDKRPKLEDLVVLRPGVPVVRESDVAELLRGLGDGEYRIRLKPRGCWWSAGEVEDEDDDGRAPKQLMGNHDLPLVLETDDKVDCRVDNGEVVRQ